MKPMSLNLSKMKKIAGDKHSSTFQHPDGHQIKVAHGPLSVIQRKQMEKLPVQAMAYGNSSVQPTSDQQLQSDLASAQSDPPMDPSPSRAPASFGSDAANVIRTGFGDAFNAAKTVASPIISQVKDFGNGLLGNQANAGEADKPYHPTASNDLKDMGEPVEIGGPSAGKQPASVPSPQGSGQPAISAGSIYANSMAGINAEQRAESQAGQSRVAADKMYQAQALGEEQNWEQERQSKMGEIQNAINDVADGHINPNHYLENMGTGQKISTAIGMILGGAAGGANGHNPAMEILQTQINRDIDAQKANLNNKSTVLGAYQEKYHNAVVAENMAKATQYGLYAAKLQQAADESADPLAKARALQAKAAVQGQILPLVNNANAIQMLNTRAQQKAQNPGAFSSTAVDYPALNTLQRTGIMPKEDVEAATKEAAQLEGSRELRKSYADSFNRLNNQAFAGKFTPADRAANINVLAAKIAKESAGRFNLDESKQIVEGIFPTAGDLASTRADKLKKGNEFFDSMDAATPTLTRYGLKNPIGSMSAPKPSHAVGDVVYVRGQKMQIVDKRGNLKPVS